MREFTSVCRMQTFSRNSLGAVRAWKAFCGRIERAHGIVHIDCIGPAVAALRAWRDEHAGGTGCRAVLAQLSIGGGVSRAQLPRDGLKKVTFNHTSLNHTSPT